jgi:TRAP-type transport system periplasmic protein
VSTIWGNKFYEVQRYINLTGHVWSYNVLSGNKSFVDGLKPAQRKVFDETLKEATAWLDRTVAEEEAALLEKIRATGKNEIVRSDVAAFQKIALPIVQKFADANCKPGLLAEVAKYAH